MQTFLLRFQEVIRPKTEPVTTVDASERHDVDPVVLAGTRTLTEVGHEGADRDPASCGLHVLTR